MTFGTVCDGIGCGHLAFKRAGFECVWSAEIEPFPCAVLAYRFPDVRNHGDMNLTAGLVERGDIAAPDVFIGGTPCQAFSVAGKRKGLSDARGNLSLTFCGIADAIDDVRGRDGKPPCVILWENVPGVLSDSGNAFGCFLGELAGSGCQLQPPGDGWGNAGCVFGPKRTVAWRVLDSQFFGVAQRRRRVFVVASAGDRCRPEEILFEREGVRRDTPPSREAGQGVAGDAGSGVAPSLRAQSQCSHRADSECYVPVMTFDRQSTGEYGVEPIASTVSARDYKCASDLIATYYMRDNGDGETVGTLTGDHAGRPTDYTPVVAFERRFVRTSGGQPALDVHPCLRADANTGDGAPCVAIGAFKGGQGSDAGSIGFSEHLSPTLNAADSGSNRVPTLVHASSVRRLTPVECERLQALPDDWAKIPWRGKPIEECPDGPRYKGIGNGQTVNVMEWLAGRVMNALERTEP